MLLSYDQYRDGGAYFGFLSTHSATSPIPVPGGPLVAPLLNPTMHIPLDETLMVTFLPYVWLEPCPGHAHFYGPMALVRTRLWDRESLHQTGQHGLCITSLSGWLSSPYLFIGSVAKPWVMTCHTRLSNDGSMGNTFASP